MKLFVLLVMLMTAIALPALAGQGTIEETDTEIVVEYSGDPGEKRHDSEQASAPATTQPAAADEGMQAPVPVPAAAEDETPPPAPGGEVQ